MPRNTNKHKGTEIKLPRVTGAKSEIQLPFNGKLVEERGFSFSFSCFDREHELFNLGGRVIGILIDAVFYVVWLDPYHNLTNSEGYGGVKKYPKPD